MNLLEMLSKDSETKRIFMLGLGSAGHFDTLINIVSCSDPVLKNMVILEDQILAIEALGSTENEKALVYLKQLSLHKYQDSEDKYVAGKCDNCDGPYPNSRHTDEHDCRSACESCGGQPGTTERINSCGCLPLARGRLYEATVSNSQNTESEYLIWLAKNPNYKVIVNAIKNIESKNLEKIK
ncbi:HEAT repeat domain-containing protein [Candidatus Woesearchaeota archaeon]|nr:HEAT repeat domain-containing protein [Candidatus Woesearchaeota archaeon]